MSEEVENGVLGLLGDLEPEEATGEEKTEVEADASEETEAKEETEEESPPDSVEVEETRGVDPQHAAMLAKAEDANRKFQEQRDRADDLQKQLDELQKRPPPDPVEDPDGYREHQASEFEGLRAEMQEQMRNQLFTVTRATISAVKDDYDEAEAAFMEEAKENLMLRRMLGEAENPALFAYQQGKKFLETKDRESFDVDAERERIREEERAKLIAQNEVDAEKKAESEAAKEAALKPSIADAGNAGLGEEAPVGLDMVAEMSSNDLAKGGRKKA